ncbi:MAG: hypothetical protein ABSG93_05430 [Solirubrobacteraceae bacterium]
MWLRQDVDAPAEPVQIEKRANEGGRAGRLVVDPYHDRPPALAHRHACHLCRERLSGRLVLSVDGHPFPAGDYGAGLLLEIHDLALNVGRSGAVGNRGDCVERSFATGMCIHGRDKCSITLVPRNSPFIS